MRSESLYSMGPVKPGRGKARSLKVELGTKLIAKSLPLSDEDEITSGSLIIIIIIIVTDGLRLFRILLMIL